MNAYCHNGFRSRTERKRQAGCLFGGASCAACLNGINDEEIDLIVRVEDAENAIDVEHQKQPVVSI